MKRQLSFFRNAAISMALTLTFGQVQAQTAGIDGLRIEKMADGLSEPWSLAFLPDGSFLITERDGRLSRFNASGKHEISGVPAVWAKGQGGLFDVALGQDFATSGRIFLSYAKPAGQGASTALATARLQGDRLSDLRDLWVQPDPTTSNRHFGGRILVDGNGDVILTTGDRGEGMSAQADEGARGRVLRIAKDGAWIEEISRGHRNPQGLAFDAEGSIWASEHGARGGDEVNHIMPGANYGWPVISYGTDYDGSKIGEGTAKPGLKQPEFYWDPSIAPSGHVVHSGAMFPQWRGHHVVGSLKFDAIYVLDPSGWSQEILRTPQTDRVRDAREGPDGALWFLSVGDGAAYRVVSQ